MGLKDSSKKPGTSVSTSKLGKNGSREVGLALSEYSMHVLKLLLMMVMKTKGPYDLIDWNDLCKSPSPRLIR